MFVVCCTPNKLVDMRHRHIMGMCKCCDLSLPQSDKLKDSDRKCGFCYLIGLS